MRGRLLPPVLRSGLEWRGTNSEHVRAMSRGVRGPLHIEKPHLSDRLQEVRSGVCSASMGCVRFFLQSRRGFRAALTVSAVSGHMLHV